jgi:hypothetical protein
MADNGVIAALPRSAASRGRSDCGGEAQGNGNGSNLLADAEAKVRRSRQEPADHSVEPFGHIGVAASATVSRRHQLRLEVSAVHCGCPPLTGVSTLKAWQWPAGDSAGSVGWSSDFCLWRWYDNMI